METLLTPIADKRRYNFQRAVIAYVPIFGIASAIGYAALYYSSRAWQFLAVAVISLVCTFIWGVAALFFNQGKLRTTVIILNTVVLAIFPAFALFWAGTGVAAILVVGLWAVLGVLVFFGSGPSKSSYLWFLGSLISTVAILWINSTQPFARVNVTDLAILRWLVPLIVVTGGSVLLVLVTRTSIAGGIYTRTMASFFLVVFIPIVSIGTITAISSYDTDRQNSIRSLENVATQKSDAIILWTAKIQSDVFDLPHDALVEQNINRILSTATSLNPDEQARNYLTERFTQILNQSDRLDEIFLMDPNGNVVAASLNSRINKRYSDEAFFLGGKGGLYISEPVYFRDMGEMSIFVSRPILNSKGQVVGVLTGRASMRAISQIVASRTGLGSSGKALVIARNYDLLNGIIIGIPIKQVNTDIAAAAVNSEGNGSMVYRDENNIPVIGVFRWLPTLNLALIAEMNQSEAYQNAQSVLRTNIIISLLAAGIALLGALITTRTISSPINSLVETANQVAAGNFQARAAVEQEDELGSLGLTLNNMTTQIQELVSTLEQRVAERTHDLSRRTTEIRTAAQVARDASVAQSSEELLSRSARLIRDRFGFYHVGIFLLDERGEYAVLSAAGGEAGQLMLANQHKLRVGDVGIVGHVAASGQPRVALDTGEDAVYFRNPLLPYTHSEMSLPLKISDRIIGVLDVQSEKVNAFDQEDIEILQVMADQIAVAIERARLLQELENVVNRMEITSRSSTERAWKEYLKRTGEHRGFRYQGIKTESIDTPPSGSDDAIEKGTSIIQSEPEKDRIMLAVPVKVHGYIIGTLNLRFQGNNIPSETISVVEQAAERLALALENSRLIQDSEHRARRERQVNIITSQVQQSTDLNIVLQNAIRELGNTLGIPKTFIQIGLTDSDDGHGDEINPSILDS